jgi:hypothetical protein
VEAESTLARAIDRQHAGDARDLVAHLGELGEALRIGEQRRGAGILQAKAERVRPEQHGDR